jgi:hypothetical protein
MPEITPKTFIEMKEQWYTSTGTDEKRQKSFSKKYKTDSDTTKRIINFFNPKSRFSNYHRK